MSEHLSNYTKQLTDRMGFGKYKDQTVRWVIDHDVEYIAWALATIAWFKLETAAGEYYQDKFDDFTFQDS